MEQSDKDFLDALNRRVRINEALRPDLLLAEIAGNEWYFEDVISDLTDEDPPSPVTERTEPIAIDEYLGIYLPEERRIKVFLKNVEPAGKRIKCDPEALRYVVHYHEQAHAIVHLGVSLDEKARALTDDQFRRDRFGELTSRFCAIEHALHEHLAQLMTYHALLRVREKLHDVSADLADDLLAAFTNLSKYQPAAYRVEPYLDVPLQRVIGSISLIRTGDLAGRLKPWRTIMQWK